MKKFVSSGSSLEDVEEQYKSKMNGLQGKHMELACFVTNVGVVS